jgi:hypothetical protein
MTQPKHSVAKVVPKHSGVGAGLEAVQVIESEALHLWHIPLSKKGER